MSALGSAAPAAPPNVVSLAGDVDFADDGSYRARLEAALGAGGSIVVDLGDCTHVGAEALRLLADVALRAKRAGCPFVVVLPYSAHALVRRVLLEIVPELTHFPIVASVGAAETAIARAGSGRVGFADVEARLRTLRASLWENASELDALLARRNVLILAQRDAVRRARTRRR